VDEQPSIMVIDDLEERRTFVSGALRAARYGAAVETRHGVQGSYAMKELLPDVLFVALGDPLARSILTVEFAHTLNPDAAVIGYTPDDSPAVLRRAIQAGVNDILPWPLSPGDIVQALATAERRRAEALAGRQCANVFAITGQKGGIGKTTIATNLAAALSRYGHRSTLIIDLDIRFGDVAVMMNLPAEFTTPVAARDFRSLSRDDFRAKLGIHPSGASVLPAPTSPHEWLAVEPSDIRALISYTATLFDCVILDTPGSLDEFVTVAIDSATRTVAVTSPDLASLKNTNLLMAYLEGRGVDRADVLLTLSRNIEALSLQRAEVERLLETRIDVEIAYSRDMLRCGQEGASTVLEHPHGAGAASIFALAMRLTGLELDTPRPSARHRLRLGRRPREAVPITSH
jgi:pilus assembly protein CpaE